MSAPQRVNRKKIKNKEYRDRGRHLHGKGMVQSYLHGQAPADPDYEPLKDEGLTRWSLRPLIREAPRGTNPEQIMNAFKMSKDIYEASAAYQFIKNEIEQRFREERIPLTNCICFALDSPTTRKSQEVIMSQLAVFVSTIELLRRFQPDGQPLRAYAQDPLFNKADKTLLERLNIKVLDHPKAFRLVGPTSLVYSPYAPAFVVRGILSRMPAIVMAPDQFIRKHAAEIGTVYAEYDSYFPNDYLTHQRLSFHAKDRLIAADRIKAGIIITRFLDGKERIATPQFRDAFDGVDTTNTDSGVISLHIYWKKSVLESVTRDIQEKLELADQMAREQREETKKGTGSK